MAVKSYGHAEMEQNACVRQHLMNENAIAARHLEHEGIIAPQSVVRRQGRTEVQMEYAPGGNLGEYARRRNGLSEGEARRLFRQIVEAVGYLHAKDICHRDIKPENIVLDSQRNAKLVDFGAAREGAHVMLHSVQGTPAFMAPEVMQGRAHAGAPSDVWSLGVTLVSLLLPDQLPFWGKDIRELKHAIAREPPKLPSTLSASCRDLLRKLLRKQAACRMTIDDVRKHPWVRGSCCGVPNPKPTPAVNDRQGDGCNAAGNAACNASVRSAAGDATAVTPTVASFLRERALLEQAHKELLASHRPQQGMMTSSQRASPAPPAAPAFRSSLAALMEARPPRPAALSAARPNSAAYPPPSPRMLGDGWRGPAPHSPRLGGRGQPLSARG